MHVSLWRQITILRGENMASSMVLKRESLFDFLDIERLKSKEFETVLYFLECREKLVVLEEKVKSILANKTTDYYRQNEPLKMKKILKVKNKFVKNKRILDDLHLFDGESQRTIVDYYQVKDYLIEEKEKYETELNKDDNDLQYFFVHPQFLEALRINTGDKYKYLVDSEKYNKFSTIQTRYNYIQRATVKTSPLSYLGYTTYLGSMEKQLDKTEVNQLVKTLLLIVAAHDHKLREKMIFRLNPLLFLETEKSQGYYYEKLTLQDNFDWLLKKTDVMHNLHVINFIKKIGSNRTVSYNEISHYTNNDPYIDAELLINNFIVYPDFIMYSDDVHFKTLFEDTISEKALTQLLINEKNDIRDYRLSEEVVDYVKINQPDYLMMDMSKKIKDISLYYHNHLKLSPFSYPPLSDNQKKYIFEEIIVENKFTSKLLNAIHSNFNTYKDWNLLEILSDLYEKILYNKLAITDNIQFKPIQKKSAIYFYQMSNSGELLINNVNLGTGSIVIRDIEIFDHDLHEQLNTHFQKLFNNDSEIYELVLDKEISNRIDVGKTQLNKLYWPNDFDKVLINFSPDNEIEFIYKEKRINIIYVGTIPFHLFEGTKGLLMSLINPWKIDVKKIQNYNNRKQIVIHKEELKELDDHNTVRFFLNITEFFHRRGLPFDFFLTIKKTKYQPSKPIWMSLYSKYSLKILKKIIQDGTDLVITNIDPDRSSYLIGGKCTEYATLEVWEEN
jgi:hypothetical protein